MLQTQRTAEPPPTDAFLVLRASGATRRAWVPATKPGDVVGVGSDGTLQFLTPRSPQVPYQGDVPLVPEPAAAVTVAVGGVVQVAAVQALADQVKALRAALNLEVAARNLLVQRLVSAGLMAAQ